MTANFAHQGALIISILSFGLYYYVLNLNRMAITELRHVKIFFLLWIAFFTFEFYFLGPYSFIEMSHEGNLNPSVDYYLANHHDGGRFSHQFGGGQDLFIMLPGMQYFNPEAFLHSFLPFWIVILFHKLYFAALGFIGTYLIARHHAPKGYTIAVAIAATFPVTHEYLLGYSTNWGPGYAAIPLALYACTIATNKKNFWSIAVLAAVILSAADPIHIFPPLAVAVIGYIILNSDLRLKRTAFAFGIYILLALIVWHEFIYANAILLKETARAIKGGIDARTPLSAVITGVETLFATTLPFTLFIGGLLLLAIARSRIAIRGAGILFWLIASFVVAKTFPWERIGMEAISKLSHYYMLLAILILFIPVLAEANKIFNEGLGPFRILHKRIRLDIGIAALALAVLTWNKVGNITVFAWFGGQSSLFGFAELSKPTWKPNDPFRTVTLFDRPPANNIAGMYNIDSFDGQPSLYLDRWVKYWDQIQKVPNAVQRTRVGLDWTRWNGQYYEIDSQIRLDLLGVANVRYLLSALPLKSKNLKLVFAPKESDINIARPEAFASKTKFAGFRFRRIFDPGELYIYELENPLPRVFSARAIDYINDSIAPLDLYNRISRLASSRTAVISDRYIAALPTAETIEIIAWEKVADGFDIKLKASKGGLVLINNSYLPYWKAWGDGKSLKVVPANAIQMAIAILPGTKQLKVRYKRPLLREKIAALF
jgi:hypothetical protein